MSVGESFYTQRGKELSKIRIVLENVMSENPISAQTTENGRCTCDVRRIIVSANKGIYIQDETEANASAKGIKSVNGTAIRIVNPEVFATDTGMLKIVTDYIKNYPRLRIIKKFFEITKDATHEEKMFITLVDTTSLYKGSAQSGLEGTKFMIDGNSFIKLEVSDVVYDVIMLYDATDKYVEKICSTKDVTAAKMFKSMFTFQGRFKDDRDVAMLHLSAFGRNRAMVSDNILYVRHHSYDDRNEYTMEYTPILNIKDHCRSGVEKCDPSLGLAIISLGINVENTNVGMPPSKETMEIGNASANSMALLKLSNIVDHDFRNIGDIIKAIKNKKTGLVMLDDTLPDEVVDAFYFPTSRWTAEDAENVAVDNDTVFGAYGNNTDVHQRNPLVNVHILKEFKDKIEKAMAGSGITNGAYTFYIMTTNSNVDGKSIYELSKKSLVFYLCGFDNLYQAYALLSEWKNEKIFDNLLYIGDLTTKGTLMYSRLIKLMHRGDIDALKSIPLRLGKLTADKEDFIEYRKYIPNLIANNTGVQSLIISSETRVVNEFGVNPAVKELFLRQEEIELITMATFEEDIVTLLEEQTIVRRIREIKVHGKSKPMRFIFNKQSNGIFKITIEPVNTNINSVDSTIGKNFDVKGYSLLCGDPSSGKHTTIRSICKSIPNKNRILVIDPLTLISPEFFENSDRLDLTIYQDNDLDNIKALLSTRPDTVIIYKLPNNSEQMLFAVADACTPEQQLIIATDKLFSDFMLSVPMRFNTKLFAHMGVIIDQVRVRTKLGKLQILYQKLTKDLLLRMPLDDWSDRKSISQWIHKNCLMGAEGLHKQIETLYTQDIISEAELTRLQYALARNYKMIHVQEEGGKLK